MGTTKGEWLPCPFCGSHEVREYEDVHAHYFEYYGRCSTCGATGPGVCRASDSRESVSVCVIRARIKWNERS